MDTGLDGKSLECQKTASMFILDILLKQVIFSDNNQLSVGKYKWVEAIL